MQARSCTQPPNDVHWTSLFRWAFVLYAPCAFVSCENGERPQNPRIASSFVVPSAELSTSVVPPVSAEPNVASTKNPRSGGLFGASADFIENALRKIGWTPIGRRVGSVKGVQCTTVLAKRDKMSAEIKSFYGYPYALVDMLELKGTAQGLGEMTMITVIVKGDNAKTDELYEQLMGNAPMRHGTGLGNARVP